MAYRDNRPTAWVKALKVLGVLCLIAVVLAGAWFAASLGPRPVSYAHPDYQLVADVPKELTDMLDQSKALESQFRAAEKMRDITPDDLPGLEEAIRLQETYIERTGSLASGNTRLQDLRTLLQNHQAEPLASQDLDLEKQAQTLENAGNLTGALALLQQAQDLQVKIDADYKLSKYVNYQRFELLRHHIDYLTAVPLNDESHQAEAAAVAAVAAAQAAEAASQADAARQQWTEAQAQYQHAFDLQTRINHEFPEQSFYDAARLQSLHSELVSLGSTEVHQLISQMLDQARAAAVAGDSLHAADLFQQAMQKQRDLIRDFPESRFADAALLDSVEIERQTALSHPVAGEIEHQADALAQDLRQQNFAEARENAAGLDQKITAFHQTYPRSTLLAGEVEQRVAYLDFKRNDFENLQKQVYDQLLALPGQTRFALYKQEVPQSLYLAVAGDNPSRNVGPALPVDSVNWNSARDFCRHLEWLLGRPVRLPTIEEFRAAAGPATAAGSAPANWNMDNSGGHTQPVATSAPNAAGYYDLLGNVGEWLERPASELDGQAPVAGGNALSPSDVLRDVPVDHVSILDQGKYTGFRFVVDLDAQAPLTTPPPAAADTIPAAPAASGSHAKDAP